MEGVKLVNVLLCLLCIISLCHCWEPHVIMSLLKQNQQLDAVDDASSYYISEPYDEETKYRKSGVGKRSRGYLLPDVSVMEESMSSLPSVTWQQGGRAAAIYSHPKNNIRKRSPIGMSLLMRKRFKSTMFPILWGSQAGTSVNIRQIPTNKTYGLAALIHYFNAKKRNVVSGLYGASFTIAPIEWSKDKTSHFNMFTRQLMGKRSSGRLSVDLSLNILSQMMSHERKAQNQYLSLQRLMSAGR